MAKLLIINETYHTPQNRVSDTITYVTLNAINNVVPPYVRTNYLSYPNTSPTCNPTLSKVKYFNDFGKHGA